VSGTGKSKLPALVAKITGGRSKLIPVRPDWTDSSDVLGYCDLQGNFRPGPLLEFAREADSRRDRYFICILDEMNLARVEQYFAEVLSRVEDRQPVEGGGYMSGPLISIVLNERDSHWMKQGLPPNLAIVGTVNMDESTHGFSRKVLDRAFTIELSDTDLAMWERVVDDPAEISPWPVAVWYPRAVRLGDLDSDGETLPIIQQVIQSLTEINYFLTQAQLQVGYRVRDEIALFVLHAREISSAFVSRSGELVDPLDLAFLMKVLPRIAGGSNAIRQVILGLLGWTYRGQGFRTEEEASSVIEMWESTRRRGSLVGAQFPRTAARLCLMWDRLLNEGFTSFWL
jgi:5-methylcytosine-specific restriction protein B